MSTSESAAEIEAVEGLIVRLSIVASITPYRAAVLAGVVADWIDDHARLHGDIGDVATLIREQANRARIEVLRSEEQP